jgi:uncharacterized membrane protein YeaQ/YmgE (transglycosylase-associated protein family)
MGFFTGLAVWLVIGVAAGLLIRTLYRATATAAALTVIFGMLGAFIGGMLGTSPYIHHDPQPLRFGSLLGAVLGALFFTFVYHYTARKAI